uniref:TNase-like domain-containing protein n=1 Tax=Heliothis virescens TaxID=7102 RepID=A0A2A4JDF0_HELVI
MSVNEEGFFSNIHHLLKQDYRGVNIAVYALATAGLAVSIHKIRPVSKFSKASTVPDHFIRKHETLKGSFVGVQHSPLRVLVDHRAPIYLPLWHSAKPPLPVKLWGIEVASMNAVNWLECVAKGQQVTLKLIARDNDDLVSRMLLHLPQHRKTTETLDVAERLVELGFATASVPRNLKKNTIESKLAPALLSAEARAKSYRNGVWSQALPPLPAYVVYWRKGSQVTTEILTLTAKKMGQVVLTASKAVFVGVKKLALRPFRPSPKEVQTT